MTEYQILLELSRCSGAAAAPSTMLLKYGTSSGPEGLPLGPEHAGVFFKMVQPGGLGSPNLGVLDSHPCREVASGFCSAGQYSTPIILFARATTGHNGRPDCAGGREEMLERKLLLERTLEALHTLTAPPEVVFARFESPEGVVGYYLGYEIGNNPMFIKGFKSAEKTYQEFCNRRPYRHALVTLLLSFSTLPLSQLNWVTPEQLRELLMLTGPFGFDFAQSTKNIILLRSGALHSQSPELASLNRTKKLPAPEFWLRMLGLFSTLPVVISTPYDMTAYCYFGGTSWLTHWEERTSMPNPSLETFRAVKHPWLQPTKEVGDTA